MFFVPFACSAVVCYVVSLTHGLVHVAPVIFPIAYNLAKPFLSEDTKKKIRVCGSKYVGAVFEYYI